MVIYSGWLFFFIVSAITTIAVVLIAKRYERIGTKPNTFVQFLLAGLFLAGPIAAITLLVNTTSTITEISTNNHSTYLTLGSFDYEASDGQIVHVDLSNEYDDYTVNVTDEVMIDDYLQYGLGISFDNGTVIPPHSSINTYGSPDYFPWDTPPSEIEVNANLGMGGKTWVHYQTSSVNDILKQ